MHNKTSALIQAEAEFMDEIRLYNENDVNN